MLAVGKQVIIGIATDNFRQPLADFAIKKAHDLADSLEREAFAAQLADHRDFREMGHRIKPTVPFPARLDDSALVPPLELAARDCGQSNYLLRCKAVLHESSDNV